MLKIVDWKPENFKGTVVVSADDFSEAGSTNAKTLAIEEATKHLGLCGISGSSGPYPVDQQGQEITDGVKLGALSRLKVQVKYHNDFYITQSLGL